MKRKIFSILFALVLALGLGLVLAAPAGANGGPTTWHVPDDYTTIQAAINAASSGDAIHIDAGTYNETLDLHGKTLTIQGAGLDNTIIDASSSTGYAIQGFGDSTTIRNLKLIGTSNSYGFKVSGVSNITLQNIRVENSYKTGVDLNTVAGATLTNIEVVNTTAGFGLMILDSNNVVITNVTTSGNAWGGVSVQTKNSTSDSIIFNGNFDAQEGNPLLLEKDLPMYYDITNVEIPNKLTHIVYAFRGPDNYKQWFYQETLDGAKALAGALMAPGPFTYSGMLIYDIAEENYCVIAGMNIQDAVDAATSGDTVNVAAGNYSEEQIVISTDISIIGDPLGKPVINPTTNLTGNNAAGAWFLVNSGVSFDLSNVVLDGSSFWIHQAIRNHGSTTIQSVDFRNIRGSASGNPYRGVAIQSFGGTVLGGAGNDSHGGGGPPSHLVVSDSTFEQIGRIGILVKGTESTAEITGCTYTGKGDGDWLDYAFEAGAGGEITVTNCVATNCTGVASVDGSTSAGILVTTYYGSGTQASITGNTLNNNTEGITVGYDASDTSTVAAHLNNISGNTLNGISTTASPVDATNNWWSDKSGPTHAGNPGGTGDAVSDNVDYDPWTGASVEESKMETVTDDTLDATGEADTEVIVNGTATVTVAKYSGNPSTGSFGGDTGKYVDVYLGDPAGVTEIEIRLYYTDADISGMVDTTLKMLWWDGDSWEECSDSGVDTTDIAGPPPYSGYMWAKIRNDTTPTLADLAGTPFGGSGSLAGSTWGGGGGGRDAIAPFIFNVKVQNITQTTVDVSWSTNEVGTSQVEYGASPSTLSPLDTNLVMSHLVHLTGLTPGTNYYFKVMSVDAASNPAVSVEYTFTTLTPGGAPAAFSVSGLSIQPLEIQGGEVVTITVSVANTGGTPGIAGSYNLVLKINGVSEAEKSVTIFAGKSQSVSFSVTRAEAGSYSVDVNGLSGSFTVVATEAPPTAPAPIAWWIWFIAGVVVVGLVIFFAARRRA